MARTLLSARTDRPQARMGGGLHPPSNARARACPERSRRDTRAYIGCCGPGFQERSAQYTTGPAASATGPQISP